MHFDIFIAQHRRRDLVERTAELRTTDRRIKYSERRTMNFVSSRRPSLFLSFHIRPCANATMPAFSCFVPTNNFDTLPRRSGGTPFLPKTTSPAAATKLVRKPSGYDGRRRSSAPPGGMGILQRKRVVSKESISNPSDFVHVGHGKDTVSCYVIAMRFARSWEENFGWMHICLILATGR